jgi:hypothetical protein
MEKTEKAAGGDAPVTIIDLGDLQEEWDGQLGRMMQETGAEDVLIRLAADIEVAGQAARPYAALVAVSRNYQMAEPLADIAEQLAEEGREQVFAWVPAHLYGSADFSIYIAEHELGENLANGLIGEIVRRAAIEEALDGLTG